MRSCSDVHNYLIEEGVAHEIVHLPAPSTTARRAADLLGVTPREIVKSLLFVTDAGPVLCLVPGDSQVDTVQLLTALDCRSAVLAPPPEVATLTGYRPGAVPPCGLPGGIPVVVDPEVFVEPVVYCGGGTTTTMLKIRSTDLRDALSPRVAGIAVRPHNDAAR